MMDEDEAKTQLISELAALRKHVSQLEREKAEYVQTEVAIRESAERSRRMLNAITSYNYSVEVKKGRAVSTRHSRECLAITGYSEEDYLHDAYLWYSMIHPSDRVVVEDAIKRILEGKVVPPIEHRIIRRDGTTVWIRNTMVPHHDQHGRLIRYDGLVEDISARKQMEAHFLWGQKMESLGRMAGAVAHNFNNIFAAVLGYAELIQLGLPPDSPVQPMVAQIVTASQRAQTITTQIVAYTGHMLLTLGRLSLSDLISGMAPFLEAGLSEKTSIKYDLSTDLPLINADTNQIRQVVINLITNAVEAIGDKRGLITISTGVMDPDTDLSGEPYLAETRRDVPYVTLEVRDDGCGMDENTRAGIFEPFFSTKFLGRGLGLPAVLGIVKRHKGFIKVVSKPGEGSAFLIGFPTAGAGPDSGLKNAGMTNDGGDSIPGQAPR